MKRNGNAKKGCPNCERYMRTLVESAVMTKCRQTFDFVMKCLGLKDADALYRLAKRMGIEK